MAIENISDGKKGKRIRHYTITKQDMEKLENGEEIFFYQGREIDIYLKFPKDGD